MPCNLLALLSGFLFDQIHKRLPCQLGMVKLHFFMDKIQMIELHVFVDGGSISFLPPHILDCIMPMKSR
jgi:hypothetical protein